MADQDYVAVQFVSQVPPYRVGEVAGFRSHVADRYVRGGKAKYYKPNKANPGTLDADNRSQPTTENRQMDTSDRGVDRTQEAAQTPETPGEDVDPATSSADLSTSEAEDAETSADGSNSEEETSSSSGNSSGSKTSSRRKRSRSKTSS